MSGPGEVRGPFRCPRCGAPTWGELNFCQQCGQDLDFKCPQCGATWRYMYEYPYCPNCGAKTGQKVGKGGFK